MKRKDNKKKNFLYTRKKILNKNSLVARSNSISMQEE